MRDRAQAEDVTHEVFLQVYGALEQIEPERDPGPWLTAIVCNTCRQVWRGRHDKASLRSVSLEDIQDLQPSHPRASGTPGSATLPADYQDIVRSALRALPDQLRETVILHDWLGLNHKEIAATLNISHDVARKRYSRALAALARLLTGWD